MDTIPSGATGHGLNISLIQRYMSELSVGNARIYVQPTVTSTNDVVLQHAAELEEATFVAVAADEQTHGRGRLDRHWESMFGLGIAVSVAIREAHIAVPLSTVPLVTGLAAIDALDACGLRAQLKWPNDIVLTDGQRGIRKLGGILVQRFSDCVVLGIGINISHSQDQLPIPQATSAALEGYSISRELLIAHLLKSLEQITHEGTEWLDTYRHHCITIGAKVSVHSIHQDVIEGIASRVDNQGHLVVDVNGEMKVIETGDVQHVRSV